MKNNAIEIITITAVVAVMGISLFACKSKASNEKIEIQLEQETNKNEQKSKENETKQYQQKQLKKGESLDGKITGRTCIENGLVMEWQEDFPMDKTIVPTRIEYRESGHSMYYNVNGAEIEVAISGGNSSRGFYTVADDDRFATITAGVNKSNEQVLKSVAAADAIEKAMKAMTK